MAQHDSRMVKQLWHNQMADICMTVFGTGGMLAAVAQVGLSMQALQSLYTDCDLSTE